MLLWVRGGRVKTPDINNKKLVVRSYMDVQRVFVFLQNSAKICRIAKNERFTSVSPQ